jgi:hypothetical protein
MTPSYPEEEKKQMSPHPQALAAIRGRKFFSHVIELFLFYFFFNSVSYFETMATVAQQPTDISIIPSNNVPFLSNIPHRPLSNHLTPQTYLP